MDTDDETVVKKYTIVQNLVVRVKRGPEATLDMTRVFLKTVDSDLESPAPYFHLRKSLKWSLKYIKWLLSIEVLPFRGIGFISWVTSYWHTVYLSDT